MGMSARKRRGRGIVLIGFAALLTVQAVMTHGINRSELYWADPEYGTTVGNLVARREEFPDRPLVVVLGTSRSQNGVDADRLSEPVPGDENPPLVYNGSIAAAHPFQMLLMLRRLIAIGVKPEAVTIELLPVTMPSGALNYPEESLPIDPKRQAMRLRYDDFDLVREYDRDRTGLWVSEWLSAQAAPWYTQRYTLTSRYSKTWAPAETLSQSEHWSVAIGPYGYFPVRVDPVPDELRTRASKAAEEGYRPHLGFSAVGPRYDRTLRALLRLCAQERITVLGLVLMPESREFRSWYAPETARVIRRYAAELADEFGTRVIDASDWIPDELFWDGHHLTARGAGEFSDRFRREVLRPWSRSAE